MGRSKGLFISPSGISEFDCTTTKTDTAERSVSICRESLQVFFVQGALAYFQVPPLGGSREEKWRSQRIRKRCVSWNLPKLSQLWLCNGGFGSCTTQKHLQTKQFVNGTWIPAEWLPVRCEIVTIDSILANSKTQNTFLLTVNAMFLHDYPLAVEPGSTPRPLVQKKILERFSTYWYGPFCRVFLGCCAVEFGNPGGTYG